MDEARLWDLIDVGTSACHCRRSDCGTWSGSIRRNGLDPYGGGFWVVGLIGHTVVWFNHLEDGFQRSPYARHGEIGEYGSMQYGLEEVVQHLQNELESGNRTHPYSSGPQPGEYPLGRKPHEK